MCCRKIKPVTEVPAYVGQVMLQQPLARRYNFHQYNVAGPEYWNFQPEKQAMDVQDQLFSYRDPSVSETAL